MFGLEVAIGPPFSASAILMDRLGEELVAIMRQRVGIDRAYLNGPKAAPACFVTKMRVFVRCPDENALAGLDHLLAPVRRPIALHRSTYEGLERFSLGTARR
jgi:hypothetical protein